MRKNTPTEESFWKKVSIKENEDCWIWNGTIVKKTGYGLHRFAGKNPTTAHRCSWIYSFGDIPDGLEVAHKCSVKACVNPSHLYLSSRTENMRELAFRDSYIYPNIDDELVIGVLKKARAIKMRSEIDLSNTSYDKIITIYNIVNEMDPVSQQEKSIDIMFCGHSRNYIVNGHEGTSFCLMCEYLKSSALVRNITKMVDSWKL